MAVLPLAGVHAGDNRVRRAAISASRNIGVAMKRVPGGTPIVQVVAKRLFRAELRRLHDVLEETPIAGGYWVWAGLLLGWAREGDVLAHDTSDADFAFRNEDLERVRESAPALLAAGFRLVHELYSNDGELTGFVFERSGIHFDFLKLTQVEDRYSYYGYFYGVQVGFEIPAQPTEPFELVSRWWLKAKDHDLDLTALYGDWRTPRLDWRTDRDSPAVVSCAPHRIPAIGPGPHQLGHPQPFRRDQS